MGKNIFADLHNHTTASDGDFSPERLVEIAGQNGVQALGVTDHDTLDGLEAAVAAGNRAGIEILPGVEISVRFNRDFFCGTLHILAYFSEQLLLDTGFCSRFARMLAGGRGEGLVRARIEKINEVFGPDGHSPVLARNLVFNDIAAYSNNASRRHFALALSQRLGVEDPAMVTRIIGNDSPAYLPSGAELDAVGRFIKTEPVVAVLAHPAAGSFPGEGHYKEVLPPVETVEQLLPEFLAAGVQGLEIFYPGHTMEHQALLTAWARKYDLLVTGGSDCHDADQRPTGLCGVKQSDYLKLKAAVNR